MYPYLLCKRETPCMALLARKGDELQKQKPELILYLRSSDGKADVHKQQ